MYSQNTKLPSTEVGNFNKIADKNQSDPKVAQVDVVLITNIVRTFNACLALRIRSQ